MNHNLFESTKIGAYYLWDHTRCAYALDLWYCAEEIACYFEKMGIFTPTRVDSIKKLGIYDATYIDFVENISFLIFVYTKQTHKKTNWYAAERLLSIGEWVDAMVNMSNLYRNEKTNQDFMGGVRSENVRAYYNVEE
jgi:hypothetical protein